MAAPDKLFLEWNDIDGQYHVNDKHGHAFGGGSYEPTDAIKHARIVSDAPIEFSKFADIDNVCVPEKPTGAIEDAEMFISALAEIGGMKVTKCFNDDMHFIGYIMELVEWNQLKLFFAKTMAQ